MKNPDKVKQGKKNKASGKAFEKKVRLDLEKNGWLVLRNPNTVIEGKFVQQKPRFNPFTRSIQYTQTGFPDFICLKYETLIDDTGLFIIRFVECKGGNDANKYLSKEEKEKVEWIKNNLKIPVIWAHKGIKRGEITYDKL